MMKWLHQLRWKLFVSHFIIVLMAYVVLLAAANVLTSLGWTSFAPLTLGAAAAETGQIHSGVTNEAVALQEQFQSVVQQALLISGFAALTAAVLVSLFVSRRIVEPIQTLSNVSRRLAQGLYRERIYLQADDEIAQLAQSVNQLAEALDQTERRRLALLADVTHELRTPLATIGGYMEGLVDGVVSANPATFNLILRETRRLQRLIEDLELLSRVEAGQLPVVARAIDLRSVLEAQIAQFEPLFSSNQVTLSLDAPEQLPQVWADPDRVAQVLINILANAYRYTPAGGQVTVQVSTDDQEVRVAVIDSGIGIAAEHLPHLFERFYRVDKSRARNSGGSGIGLAIARHLIYAQGGEIWAESDGIGKGARFIFTLPLAPQMATIRLEPIASVDTVEAS
ncbi:ATP-binding protein [Chloroflexus sp. MS-CIW-1]|jgi:histidine kinase|uniref:sensor histidine kinase n=1 Tax=Chloroflexus sp. MS-CIW-1 TaxID=3055768 RepID=UPI001B0AB710|nr:ATP-binding protein [Chloroflexus sp. MS-CIW-1]MBO9348320.1 HAMP domain-containing protein [Chloroflexus sp.]MDN5272257.1 ATP-binding protein [Chloroflexus sp. MS-CIW-1]